MFGVITIVSAHDVVLWFPCVFGVLGRLVNDIYRCGRVLYCQMDVGWVTLRPL